MMPLDVNKTSTLKTDNFGDNHFEQKSQKQNILENI